MLHWHNYLSEASAVMKATKLSLILVGVWPDSKCSKLQKIFSKFAFMISFIMIGYFIVVVQTTKLFTSKGDLDIIVDILSIADFPVFISLLKLVILRFQAKGKKSFLINLL